MKPLTEYNRNVKGYMRHKDTRTSRYLKGTSSRYGFGGSSTFPAVSSPSGRNFVPRLTILGSAKLDYYAEGLSRTVSNASKEALFFCDTSLFDDRTDVRLWEALLNREGKMVIVPPVRKELEPWLSSHANHVAGQAILNEESSVWFLGLHAEDERGQAAFEYYTNLLGFRKRLVRLAAAKFEEEYGRAPSDGELRDLKRELHNEIGPRGYVLAKKGATAEGSPNLFTDEILVYLAMRTGIETGREVVILSKDEDILEQFYKLQWLLDAHYRSMLLADLYAREPGRFISYPMPKNNKDLEEMFSGDDNILVERPDWLIMGWTAPILPTYCRPVVVHCWIVGDRLSQMAFCAEREMERLLHTKGVTGGLNTYKFGEKNCHLWLAPCEVPKSLRGCAAITQDRRTRSGLIEMPLFDANQVVYSGEWFRHIAETSSDRDLDKKR